MISINDFLDLVLDDFKNYVDSSGRLCKLKTAHYDRGMYPDYSDIHIQQYYLLRYAYAYAFEYKVMYQRLRSRFAFGNSIEVTSIGCGNFLDYWSLSRVVGSNSRICYRGIDTVDWAYKFPKRACDDVQYSIENVLELFQKTRCFSSDVFIFPKSISEFPLEDVRTLANCFTSDNIEKNTIHFMFSLRTEQGSIQRDLLKTSVIFDRLIQCGFHTQDQNRVYNHFSESIQGKKIREVDTDFTHPGDVVDCLKELYAKCSDYQNCSKKEECTSRLARWPILNCKQAAWQIISFER